MVNVKSADLIKKIKRLLLINKLRTKLIHVIKHYETDWYKVEQRNVILEMTYSNNGKGTEGRS